jgi:DNA polymerase III subunit alpha
VSAEFVHLHVHSQYSMLDGALKVKDLVRRTKALGMPSVAMTDHGNMFGAIALYKAAKEAEIGAILGCELDVSTNGHTHHLPLLAETAQGYKNLVWLVSRGHVAPIDGRPAIRLEDLEGRTEGIIGLTGCMGGVLAQRILEEGEAAGDQTLERMASLFPKSSLYVELQDHGLPEQPILNDILARLAERHGLHTVATNDAHYGTREDAEAHLYLACIKSGRSYEEAKERHHGSSEMFLKSADEMAALFDHRPEAVKRTLEIAERCKKLKLKLGEPMLPTFPVPDGYDVESYFRHVSRAGLAQRFSDFRTTGKTVDEEAYKARLEMELNVICSMKFPGYFLIVWDFIRYAKENGIPVGPGRGSGAGSIVAYALRITDLDPIPYNLLFERFLNPERVSMPDFDIDFCMDKRDGVIRYVQQKYGEDSVGQIATFAELKAKSVVKDVARAIAITPMESQQIANLIPRKNPAETYSIAESLTIEPKLKARYDTEPRIRELLDQAQKLEGLTRHAGKHAAGIVISEGPLWDHVPVFKDEKEGSYVTQYYKDDVELAGLVKFDFLGLKTLTVLDVAVRLINARPDRASQTFDLAALPLDDVASYQLLGTGETKGVFQLESSGMQQLFKDLRADCFEDIVAAVALYRPGPLGSGMVGDFVNRKNGRAPIAKMHDLVDHLLLPTYGVIVYQEQVMQIAQALAGYSLGGADLLRRAMGKKKPEEMAKQKSIFLDGAKANNVAEADAEHIFGLLEYFAGYGFNKSHSAAYALITYQTAYLKAHFPVELLCAILTSDKDRVEKVVRTIADARAMGITVLPPDVNESDMDFKVVYSHPAGDKPLSRKMRVKDKCGPQIRFGLAAVRGAGEGALETLFDARNSGGGFKDIFDFGARVDAKKINKGILEALVQCGAFDTTLPSEVSRARTFASIEVALERSRSASRDRERGQSSLFGLFDAASASSESTGTGEYLQCPPWDSRETLVREQRALGFYVSGHPLERYMRSGDKSMGRMGCAPAGSLNQMDDWSVVKVAGMVEGYRERIFKDGGGKVAFFELEDLSGRVNVKVRGSSIETYASILTSGEPVVVSGKVSFPHRGEDAAEESDENREATLLLSEVTPLVDTIRTETKSIAIRLKLSETHEKKLVAFRELIASVRGECPISLYLMGEDGAEALFSLGITHRVEIGDPLFSGLEKLFGGHVAELR